MDKSGANKAAMDEINGRGETLIIARQVKYLNNIVEQDHRAIKRVTRPMLNFKSFRAARNVLAGIELMHMIRKGQLMLQGCSELSFADQFYALAGKIRLFEELAFVLPETRSSAGNATEPIMALVELITSLTAAGIEHGVIQGLV